MKTGQVEFINSQLIITGKKTPLIIRIILIIILFICILIPFAATYFTLANGKGPHISLVISFIFFGIVGFYLLRIILWNTYGREILNFEKDEINYVADYRLFKDSDKKITADLIDVIINTYVEEQKAVATLSIINGNNIIETVLKVPLNEMEIIEGKINERYRCI